ncbi:hypothetical protein LX87_05397 [Larkinella arboricola]|uniref:Uncharacterized protein n=1 Tax=Larkinella arboricola TaxID=643671 RepID=A0A327WJG0_LARAB|nr:hypothetical protein [Larkinella arboricola]RAJ90853.1 hypothetical protein LX87_05397 [Larkinella arboricola]
MTVEDLVPLSGDSILMAWQYVEDKLIVTLELSETDATVSIAIKSKWFAIDVPNHSSSDAFRTCYIEIAKLKDSLAETNGFYVPAKEFVYVVSRKWTT